MRVVSYCVGMCMRVNDFVCLFLSACACVYLRVVVCACVWLRVFVCACDCFYLFVCF